MSRVSRNLDLQAEIALRELGRNIKVARKRRKVTLADLAERNGVSVSTIVRLEKGDPTVAIGTVVQILSTLNLISGLTEVTAPENDVRQVIADLRNVRLGKGSFTKKVFSDSDLQF